VASDPNAFSIGAGNSFATPTQPQKRAGPWLTLPRMPGVNRQGQAHIVSTAIVSPRSGKGSREVEATPWFRTWFSIDPQPASISPTINISIVFICAVLDCGRIVHHPAIKNELHPKHVHAPSRYERTAILAQSCEAQPSEWQHVGSQINAAAILASANFINVHRMLQRLESDHQRFKKVDARQRSV